MLACSDSHWRSRSLCSAASRRLAHPAPARGVSNGGDGIFDCNPQIPLYGCDANGLPILYTAMGRADLQGMVKAIGFDNLMRHSIWQARDRERERARAWLARARARAHKRSRLCAFSEWALFLMRAACSRARARV